MPNADRLPASRRWPLRGLWFAWIWMSWAVCAALVVGGIALVVLGSSSTGAGLLVPLSAAVLLFAIAAVIGWQLVSTALGVTLDADGAITVRRQRGALHTHVARVERLRPSALRSTYTPTVLETADGWAYLLHPRPERDELIAAFRDRNPDIVVDI